MKDNFKQFDFTKGSSIILKMNIKMENKSH